jgi:hypothetical protein
VAVVGEEGRRKKTPLLKRGEKRRGGGAKRLKRVLAGSGPVAKITKIRHSLSKVEVSDDVAGG